MGAPSNAILSVTTQICKDVPAQIQAFRKLLEPLRQSLSHHRWLGGDEPNSGDIAIAGNFLVSVWAPWREIPRCPSRMMSGVTWLLAHRYIPYVRPQFFGHVCPMLCRSLCLFSVAFPMPRASLQDVVGAAQCLLTYLMYRRCVRACLHACVCFAGLLVLVNADCKPSDEQKTRLNCCDAASTQSMSIPHEDANKNSLSPTAPCRSFL